MSVVVDIDSIINKIALDNDLDPLEVRKAVNSQFRFVKKVISYVDKEDWDTEGLEYPQVRLPYFGRFYVKGKRAKHVKKFSEKARDGLTQKEYRQNKVTEKYENGTRKKYGGLLD